MAVASPEEQAQRAIAGFAAGWRGAAAELSAHASALAALGERARRAHPELPIDDDLLLQAVAARAPSEPGALGAYLERCRVEELALARAAAAGHVAAIAKLERSYAKSLEAVCRRFAAHGDTVDDLWQALRERLYVGDDARAPKLAEYGGQGFLENWLRVTAVRLFLDRGKRKDRAREVLAGSGTVAALPEPQALGLELVKAELREHVTAALVHATGELAPAERHLLRQHLIAGLSIDQLGAALGLHRATAARRIAAAKERLVEATRRELARRHRLSDDELDELLPLVMSRLEVSLRQLLATGGE